MITFPKVGLCVPGITMGLSFPCRDNALELLYQYMIYACSNKLTGMNLKNL